MEKRPPPTIARRHHTVPRFYLQGFARDDRIATVRLPGDRRFIQSVRDATVINNFYSVRGHDDGEDVVEKALSDLEGAAAAVVAAIKRGTWPLPLEHRMTLGHYVALQATRVPVQRRTMDFLARQVLRIQIGAGGKAALRRRLEQEGEVVSKERLESIWAVATGPEGPPVQTAQTVHIQQMLEMASELVRYVVGRPWLLVRFHRRSLITSDAPVGLVPAPENEPWQGVGFLTAWGLTFPLTRKLGLLMSSPDPIIARGMQVQEVHRGRADMVEQETTMLERFFNLHTTANASEWLFHHPNDERFVPTDLPEATPVAVEFGGKGLRFDGDAWFGSARES